MKKIYALVIAVVCMLSVVNFGYAQTPPSVDASVSSPTILCGDSVLLSAVGNQYNYVINTDFNTPAKQPGNNWAATSSAVYTNPCGAGPDGAYIWMGNTADVPRRLTTTPIDLTPGGFIRFKFRMCEQNVETGITCEGVEKPDEGVRLEFSNPAVAAGAWQTIYYFDPRGGQDPLNVNWNTHTFTIPAQAMRPNTSIRWSQDRSDGINNDHWGLDDIEIAVNNPSFEFNWPHADAIYRSTANTPKVAPITTTTYTVNYRDIAVPGMVYTDNVTVTVLSPTADATATPVTVCKGQPIQLNVESSYNATLPLVCGQSSSNTCNSLNSKAGEYQVGNGNRVSGFNNGTGSGACAGESTLPIFGDFGDDNAKTQILYRANELRARGFKGGKITNLQLEIQRTNSEGNPCTPVASLGYDHMQIQISCTGSNTVGASNFLAGSFVTVYNDKQTNFSPGWQVFNFDRYFDWDGQSNLIVQICWYQNTNNQERLAYTRDTVVGYSCMANAVTNASANNTVCNATAFYSTVNYRPNTRFGTCEPRNVALVYNWTGTGITPALADDKSPVVSSNIAGNNTYTVSVVPQGFSQCAVTDNVVVNVLDAPAPPTVMGDTVCQAQNIVLTVQNPIAGVTYEWDYPDVGGANNAVGTSITRAAATPAMSGNYLVRGVVTTGNCAGQYSTVIVSVRPTPAAPTATPQRKCVNEAATHSANTIAGPFRYIWTGPSGYTANTKTPAISRNPTVPGAYTVIRTDTSAANCNSAVTNFTVVADALPTPPALSTNPANICPGSNFNLVAVPENRVDTFTNSGFPLNRKTRSIDYSYTYNWTGATALTNATTTTASTTAATGTSAYDFVYTRTRRDTTFTYSVTNVQSTSIDVQQCSSNPVTINVTTDLPTTSNRTIFCDGDQTGYTVSFDVLGGSAPYTVVDAANVPVVGSFATVAGVLRFTSNKLPNGAFSLKVRDNKGCESALTSGNRDCTVPCKTEVGSMSISTPIKVCESAPSTAVTYNSTGEFYEPGDALRFIMHDKLTILDAGVTIFESRTTKDGFTYNAAKGMAYGQTYRITAVIGQPNLSEAGIILTSMCTRISDAAPIIFNRNPIADVSVNDPEICNGSNAVIEFDLSGTGPYDVTYSDGVTTPNLFLNNISDGRRVTFNTITTPLNFSIVSVKDEGTQCTNATAKAGPTVSLVGGPTPGTAFYECDNTQEFYKVKFPITGGDALSYRVLNPDGSVAGGMVSNFGAGIDTFFATDMIASGSSFTYTVTDINNCAPIGITVQTTCSCITDAGTLVTTTQNICEGQQTAANLLNTNFVLDGNDVLRYVLHTGSGGSLTNLGTVLDTNSTTSFGFLAGMSYGTTYYISRLAGNKTMANEVDATDLCAVITPAPIPVTFIQAPRGFITGDNTICEGQSTDVVLNFTAAGVAHNFTLKEGTQNTNYTNFFSGDFVQVTPLATTTYQLVSFGNGTCPGIVTGSPVVVTVNPTEVANFAYPIPRYCRETTVIASPTGTRTAGVFSYTAVPTSSVLDINTGSGAINIANSDVGIYTITYTTTGPCPVFVTVPDAIMIDAPAVQPTLSYLPKFCQDVLPANANPLSYTPLGGEFTSSSSKLKLGRFNGRITPATSDPGTYTITYSVNSGVDGTECPSKRETASVIIYANPQAKIVPSEREICVGEIIELNATPTTSVDYTYTVSIGATSGSAALPNAPTNKLGWKDSGVKRFSVSVTDKVSGCTSPVATDSVRVYAIPVPEFTASETLPFIVDVARGYPITFNEQAQNEATYEWDMGDGTKLFDPIINGYIYTATNTTGYEVTLTVDNPGTCPKSVTKGKIIVTENSKLFVPSAFSPNDDSENDYFKPVTIGAKSYTFEVFSRWGELIYTGNDTQEGWDGFYKNAEAPDGVYIYIVNAIMYSGKPEVQHGVVTLVR